MRTDTMTTNRNMDEKRPVFALEKTYSIGKPGARTGITPVCRRCKTPPPKSREGCESETSSSQTKSNTVRICQTKLGRRSGPILSQQARARYRHSSTAASPPAATKLYIDGSYSRFLSFFKVL